ncbi:MAG: hypothetical protein K0S55_1955 [Clostridia bacterium]|jgi:hypothetical protein|nr:hypothetical protein [Clostridia bacterium]
MNTKKKIIDNITIHLINEGLFYIFENYDINEIKLKNSVNQFLTIIFGYNNI